MSTTWVTISRGRWDHQPVSIEMALYDCAEGYGIECLRAKATGAPGRCGKRRFVQIKLQSDGVSRSEIAARFFARLASPISRSRLVLPELENDTRRIERMFGRLPR